jgi:hypothetical protein
LPTSLHHLSPTRLHSPVDPASFPFPQPFIFLKLESLD